MVKPATGVYVRRKVTGAGALIDIEVGGKCDPRFPQPTRVTETRPGATMNDDEKK